MNADWHREHPMPPRASFEVRLAWHREHARACGCREMPGDIRAELIRRGEPVTRRVARKEAKTAAR